MMMRSRGSSLLAVGSVARSIGGTAEARSPAVTREILVADKYLFFPVKTGAHRSVPSRWRSSGAAVRWFDIELADGQPDWWAPLDVSPWRGQKLTITADKLPPDSEALDAIDQGDTLKDGANLYHEALRPSFISPPGAAGTTTPTAWSSPTATIICSFSTIRMAGTGATCTGAMPSARTWCTGAKWLRHFIPTKWGRCSPAAPSSIGTTPAVSARTASRRWC